MTTLNELLSTLTPAAKRANTIWASTEAQKHLKAIEKLLPYDPDLPYEVATYLRRIHYRSTDPDLRERCLKTGMLQYIAVAGGLTGAILMATTHLFGLAFCAFCLSSVTAGIVHYNTDGQLKLAALDCCYTLINLYGIWKWLLN